MNAEWPHIEHEQQNPPGELGSTLRYIYIYICEALQQLSLRTFSLPLRAKSLTTEKTSGTRNSSWTVAWFLCMWFHAHIHLHKYESHRSLLTTALPLMEQAGRSPAPGSDP